MLLRQVPRPVVRGVVLQYFLPFTSLIALATVVDALVDTARIIPSPIPAGFNHWIPEILAYFLLAGFMRTLTARWLTYTTPFIGVGLAELVLVSSGALPNPLPLVFVASYYLGLRYLPPTKCAPVTKKAMTQSASEAMRSGGMDTKARRIS